MIKKKLKELRDLSTQELEKMRSDIQGSVRSINFKMKIERPTNLMEKKNLKNKIAVINTILGERKTADALNKG
jgi:ribosomal protein L29